MSDLCMYKLEDIVWDELAENKDHIVPRAVSENHEAVEHESSKRPRYELSYADSNAECASVSDNVSHRNEDTKFSSLKADNRTMMEKSPWSRSSEGDFSASPDVDPKRKSSSSTRDEALNSTQCVKSDNLDSVGPESCTEDLILGDQSAAGDKNLYSYQPGNGGHTENDLGFFSNDLQEKDSNDLLYYGWPEIENFEDVDRMFRSCDSTFGINDDELGWFSSSHGIEGTDDAPNLSFNFSSCDPGGVNTLPEQQEVYGQSNTYVSASVIDEKPTPLSWKRTSQKLSPNGSPTVLNSYDIRPGASPHTAGDLQFQSHVSPSKHRKPSEGKRKDRSSSNGSVIHFDNQKEVAEVNHTLDFHRGSAAEVHIKQDFAHQSSLQKPTSFVNFNNGHPINQVLASPRSSILKSDDNGTPSVSQRESSYGSSQMLPMESSREISFQNPIIPGNRKKERVHHRRFSGRPGRSDLVAPKCDSDSISAIKKRLSVDNDTEGQSEVNNSEMGSPGELDSANVRESSCTSSVLDEVSIEASSFRQLQQVMEQLDIRTKLCIRDSLYRLARSAEQRHKCVNPTSLDKDDKDPRGGLISDESNKGTSYMDIETDTNPIDRSIAHLLFHRPSDSSTPDAAAVKSLNMAQAPISDPMAEKLVCEVETTSDNNEASGQ